MRSQHGRRERERRLYEGALQVTPRDMLVDEDVCLWSAMVCGCLGEGSPSSANVCGNVTNAITLAGLISKGRAKRGEVATTAQG
jgi:hypothetical protein